MVSFQPIALLRGPGIDRNGDALPGIICEHNLALELGAPVQPRGHRMSLRIKWCCPWGAEKYVVRRLVFNVHQETQAVGSAVCQMTLSGDIHFDTPDSKDAHDGDDT
jgi:hypothetical protein